MGVAKGGLNSSFSQRPRESIGDRHLGKGDRVGAVFSGTVELPSGKKMENRLIASGMLSGRDNFDAEKDKVLDWRNRFSEESYHAEQGPAAF